MGWLGENKTLIPYADYQDLPRPKLKELPKKHTRIWYKPVEKSSIEKTNLISGTVIAVFKNYVLVDFGIYKETVGRFDKWGYV